MKFRKKPIVVEAFNTNWNIGAWPAWAFENPGIQQWFNAWEELREADLIVTTLEGQHIATWGDWIIKGVNGEIYPCKADIFEATYEAVE